MLTIWEIMEGNGHGLFKSLLYYLLEINQEPV
jgi:hypothetical protein